APPRLARATSGEGPPAEIHADPAPDDVPATWQPTPFVPWHQPFFNESGIYHVSVILPCDQEVACTGKVGAPTKLPGGRHRLDLQAIGVREFTFICSARYRVFEGEAKAGPGGSPVRVRIVALPEHEFYAKEMVRIACEALNAYALWFGAYPWPEFTIAESYF